MTKPKLERCVCGCAKQIQIARYELGRILEIEKTQEYFDSRSSGLIRWSCDVAREAIKKMDAAAMRALKRKRKVKGKKK